MENGISQNQESNLKSGVGMKRSIFWKIYFFFITLLSALGMIMTLSDPSAGMAEYIYLPLWVIGTVGLFGFVFLKAIIKPDFWLKFVAVYIAYNGIYYFITNIDQRMGMNDLAFYITTGISLLISIPAYYAIYAYSKPSNPIWKSA